MVKDPYQIEDTAYEVLGISFDAGLPEVHSAMERFEKGKGKESRELRSAAAEAQKKLKSPVDRAEIDIWIYDFKLDDKDEGPFQDVNLDEFTRPQALPVSELYCDLFGADLESEKRKITPLNVKFGDVRVFDNLESIRFTPTFDR